MKNVHDFGSSLGQCLLANQEVYIMYITGSRFTSHFYRFKGQCHEIFDHFCFLVNKNSTFSPQQAKTVSQIFWFW